MRDALVRFSLHSNRTVTKTKSEVRPDLWFERYTNFFSVVVIKGEPKATQEIKQFIWLMLSGYFWLQYTERSWVGT